VSGVTGRKSISVIIPTWNEQQTVGLAVASAWAAKADQVIVVDGGSSDQTVAIAGEVAEVLISPKSGRGIQQALGAAAATGDVLVFLHADTVFKPDAFLPLQSFLENSSQPMDCHWGCFVQVIEDDQAKFRWVEAGNRWRVRWLGWVYGDQGLWVTKAALTKVGGMPEDPLMEDLILSRRLYSLSRPVEIQSQIITSARRWKKDGVVNRTLKNWMLLVRFFLGASPETLYASYHTQHSSVNN